MQILITADQIKALRVYLDPLVVSALIWFAKRSFNAVVHKLNKIVTDNNNRIKEDIIQYIDKKFEAHEVLERECINELKKAAEEFKKRTS